MLVRDRLDTPWRATETVDAAELAKFTAMAEEWWNPNGRFRAMHKFNPVRRDFILDRVCNHFQRDVGLPLALSGLKVLDVGCGAGLLCEPMAAKGAVVVGIDASARNVEVARWHAARSALSVDYRHQLADDLVEHGETFDVVLNTEVVEHVRNPSLLMEQCCDMVRPGGIMIVATLNRTLRSFALAIVGAEYVLGWLPRHTHEWRRFVRPAELRAMVTPQGLKIEEEVGVTFKPLQGRWGLSTNTSVNYMTVATRGH